MEDSPSNPKQEKKKLAFEKVKKLNNIIEGNNKVISGQSAKV